MPAQIEMRETEPRHYVGIRRVVQPQQIASTLAEILPRMASWLLSRSITPVSAPITVYHSVNRQTGEFDIQVGFFVAQAQQADGDFTPGTTSGGSAVFATHVGGYASIGDTWHACFAHAGALGEVTASAWEIYVDNPSKVAEADLRTEIFVPVDPVST